MPMRTLHTCEILYSPELESPRVDHAVLVDEEGTILDLGPADALREKGDRRFDHQVLMPGVVNAHIHLTDAGRKERVPGGEGLVPWIGGLMGSRDAGLSPEERDNAICATLEEMRRKGTVAVGEVVNNERTLAAIRACGMRCRLIHELIAFRQDRIGEVIAESERLLRENAWDDTIQWALGAHAPYSVAPELMRMIVARSRAAGTYFYQHLAEDPDERDLYIKGTGRCRDFMEEIGAWEESWKPVGLSPISFYDRLGVLNPGFVAVHLADASEDEIGLLGRREVKAVLSPRSNLHITGLFPNVGAMVDAGMIFGFGTDGRGSSPTMDVFDEASVALERFPDLPPGILLSALTACGADVLGFHDLGRIEIGKRPGLVSIRINEPVTPDLEKLEEGILLKALSRERIV